jgi:hypothetical protein
LGRKRGVQYRMGSFYRSDDRSGFTVRSEQTRQEWQDLIVDQKLWEPRQPQDLVKGVADDQTVPEARPVPPPTFVGPIYAQLTANVVVGATFLPIQYIAGFANGDNIGVMLDTGALFNTTVFGNPISTGINIANPMPFTAASGNLVTDYEHIFGVTP